MNRFAIAGVLILMAAALGFWWMVPKQAGGDRLKSAPPSDEKSTSVSFKEAQTGRARAEIRE